jgi:hypothetical protein
MPRRIFFFIAFFLRTLRTMFAREVQRQSRFELKDGNEPISSILYTFSFENATF